MQDSLTIAISPGMQDISLSKGDSYEGEFFVLNPSSSQKTIKYHIAVSPMSFENDSYELYFDYPMDYNQIVDWITIEEQDGTLEQSEKRAIKYRIDVPENAPDGSQYAAFLVRIVTDSEEKPVGVSVVNNSQIAMLLYTTIEGETKKDGVVLENNISPIYLNVPVKTSSVLENIGNVHIPATFRIKVSSLLTDEELYSNEESPETVLIIPGTSHYSERVWGETPKLGLYKVVQEIDFGGRTDTEEKITFVCPTWFLILFVVFVLSCAIFLIESHRRRKIYKNPLKKY